MLEIKYLSTSDLIPYISNSRTHTDSQVKQIAASIREFGFTNPVLIDENATIVAGHGRLRAAILLNIDKIPTIELKGLTDAQRRAYVIADNKLALNADWDTEILLSEIERLQDENFAADLLGFDPEEITKMLNLEEENEPKEWTGDTEDKWQLLIEYDNEEELQKAFYEAQKQELQCKIIM